MDLAFIAAAVVLGALVVGLIELCDRLGRRS